MSSKDTSVVDVMGWLTKRFSFDKPDTNFIMMEEGNGYTNSKIGATIKYITFPSAYKKSKKEFEQLTISKTSLFVDSITVFIKSREYFTVISEEVSPDSSKYENQLIFMTLTSIGEVTVCVFGVYPKSYDTLLREKFIKSSYSITEA